MTLPREAKDFYSELAPFTDFAEVLNPQNYVSAPTDSWLIIADVEGSTAAIEQGRYKDVNLAGAACIAALTNACPILIPFIFGGDGANFLVPSALIEIARQEMARTQNFVRSHFDLGLRVGFVPLTELQRQGATVQIAKYQLTPGNVLAMFRGDGVAIAEKMVKEGPCSGGAFTLPIPEDANFDTPNLAGLSCRWNLVRGRAGKVLTILISATDPVHPERVYQRTLSELRKIFGAEPLAGNPVREGESRMEFSGAGLDFERRFLPTPVRRLPGLSTLAVRFGRLILKTVFAAGFKIGDFDPRRYSNESVLNADYRKFDDLLRFVVDCTPEQARQLEQWLHREQAQGSLHYGIHASDSALMTCFVKSPTQNQHVHFVDGSGGGYASAAKDLKRNRRQFPITHAEQSSR